MLKKIISGGQTGADRAALDLAIKFDIPHGGWIPLGRKTEAGPLPMHYSLSEMKSSDYPKRTRQNIIDSHGTVIISRGQLSGGSKLTLTFSKVVGKPNCYLDLFRQDHFEAAMVLQSFILENQIEVLNVAGPRASSDPNIYHDVKSILESVVYLFFLDSRADKQAQALLPSGPVTPAFPKTGEEAVCLLSKDLDLRAKTHLARLDRSGLAGIYFGWLDYLKERTGLDRDNFDLIADLRQGREPLTLTIEDGVMEILKLLKISMDKAYNLKVLK